MTQRKPVPERSKRRGSENRQRQKLVAVRFSPAEYAVLQAAAAALKKPQARLLREAFLASVKVEVLP